MDDERRTQVLALWKPSATAEERRRRLEAAHQMVSDLCHVKRRWTMTIPVQPDDPDVVIGAALNDLDDVLKKLDGTPWEAIKRMLGDIGCAKREGLNSTLDDFAAVLDWWVTNAPRDANDGH